MISLLAALTLVVLLLLFRAALVMFGYAAVAATFGWPSLSYGAAIGAVLVVSVLTSHLAPKTPHTVVHKPQVSGNVKDIEKLLKKVK